MKQYIYIYIYMCTRYCDPIFKFQTSKHEKSFCQVGAGPNGTMDGRPK